MNTADNSTDCLRIIRKMLNKVEIKKTLHQNKLILPKQPHHDEFLKVMDKVFHYSCFFGVVGIESRWHLWILWSAFLLLGLLIIECNAIWKVIKALAGWAVDIVGHRSVTARFAGTIFYTTSILSLIFCSRLSFSWGELSAFWATVERTVAVKLPSDETLKKRIIAFTVFVTLFLLFEHTVSMVSLIGFDCPKSLILKKYTLLSHGFFILRTEYADWMPIPIFFMSTIATILWNFQDLLIVLLGMGLTSRYHRLNQCVAKICAIEKKQMRRDKKTETLTIYTWRKIREAYVKQAKLVRKIDSALGAMILLSSFSNFYFICLQLFLGITEGKTSTVLRRFYYVVSLAWQCIRVISVVLSASDVTVYSRRALKHIFACDAQCYNIEMERLQNQLTKDYVALSGMGFFYLSRTILLQMAGAVITYELVLIQFDDAGSSGLFATNATYNHTYLI